MSEGLQEPEQRDEDDFYDEESIIAARDAQSSESSDEEQDDEYFDIQLIRRQHRKNLLAIMRQAMLTADYCTATGAIGTLLTCMPELVYVPVHSIYEPELHDDMLDLLWNMLEVFRQHSVAQEQMKRYLDKVTVLSRMELTMRQVAKLEVILAHWTQDKVELRTCLELIRDEIGRKHMQALSLETARNFIYHLSAFEAFIYHSTWLELVLNSKSGNRMLGSQYGSQRDSQYGSQVLSQPSSVYSTAEDSIHAQISQQLLGPLQLGPFLPREDLLTVLHQADQEATQPSPGFTQPSQDFTLMTSQGFTQPSDGLTQNDAVDDDDVQTLQRALHRCLHQLPAALLPALLLCHTLAITGNQDAAADVALSAVTASDRSPEALSLLAVVKEQAATQAVAQARGDQVANVGTQASQHVVAAVRASQAGSAAAAGDDDDDVAAGVDDGSGGEDVSTVHEYVGLCLEVLWSDPWQLGAVQGLLQMSTHCDQCAAAAIRGLLAHLDVAALEDPTPAAAAAAAVEAADDDDSNMFNYSVDVDTDDVGADTDGDIDPDPDTDANGYGGLDADGSGDFNAGAVLDDVDDDDDVGAYAYADVYGDDAIEDVVDGVAVDAASTDPSQATLWSVLSVLLLQLATQVALDAAQQAAAAATAALQLHTTDMDLEDPCDVPNINAKAAAAVDNAPTAAQLLWEGLQEDFASRRSWWATAGGVADVSAARGLWPSREQEQQLDSKVLECLQQWIKDCQWLQQQEMQQQEDDVDADALWLQDAEVQEGFAGTKANEQQQQQPQQQQDTALQENPADAGSTEQRQQQHDTALQGGFADAGIQAKQHQKVAQQEGLLDGGQRQQLGVTQHESPADAGPECHHHQQQHQEEAAQMADGACAQPVDHQEEAQQSTGAVLDELVLLRGSQHSTDFDADHHDGTVSCQTGTATAQTAAPAADVTTGDGVMHSMEDNGQGKSFSPPQTLYQVLCCKAVALLFVLGPDNAYSVEVADALAVYAAVAAAAAACWEEAGAASDSGDEFNTSVTAASAALQDAFQLCQQTDEWLQHRRQQQTEEVADHQKQQQQQQQASQRLLGTHSELFGGYLNMPDSWWACFPHRRRQQR